MSQRTSIGEIEVPSSGRVQPAGDAGAADRGATGAAAHGCGEGPIEGWIGFRLRQAQAAAFNAFARRVGRGDLRPGRFALMKLIAEYPGISQTALSRIYGRDKSTLTPALSDLERRGLVVRERIEGNRRSYALQLTADGQVALEQLTACAVQHERDLDRIVGAADRTRFLEILEQIIAELSSEDEIRS